MRFSTVTPGKLAVFCRKPVSRLNTVLLPEFGLPTSAIVFFRATVRRSSGTRIVLGLAIDGLRKDVEIPGVGLAQ